MTSISKISSSQGRNLSCYSQPVEKYNAQYADEIHRMAVELILHFSGKALADNEVRKQLKEKVGQRMPGLNTEEMALLKSDVVKCIFCSI